MHNETLPIRNILFDLDGTLVDSLPGIEYAVREAVRAVLTKREARIRDLRRFIGAPIRELLHLALPGVDEATLDILVERFRALYNNDGWRRTAAYISVPEILAHLIQVGVRLFVVTNKPAVPTHNILEALRLLGYFTETVSPDSHAPSFASKSQATRYLMDRYQLRPDATLLVGDTPEDEMVACACGLRFAAVTYGYGNLPVGPETGGNYILARFSDLLQIVTRLKG